MKLWTKMAGIGLSLGFTVAATAIPVAAMGNVTVKTNVSEQNEIIGGSIECPAGPWGDAFSANIGKVVDVMPAPQAQGFLDALSDFSGKYGDTGPAMDSGSEICSAAAPYVS